MKRIIIICEGQTETEFCKDVLAPYFSKWKIFIEAPLIKKSGGGIVPWNDLKRQIEIHLKQDISVFVTTLIDYYGIPERFGFPDWEVAHLEQNKSVRMEILENGMLHAIQKDLQERFVPYIQLHEFEGLLFNEIEIFARNFKREEFVDLKQFHEIFKQFPNPEDINDGSSSAPSKRLLHHIKGYNKIVFGATLATEIGLSRIREKCPRFNTWIDKIENC